MDAISLYGGPYDGRVELLEEFYERDGESCRRQGWPLIIEFHNSVTAKLSLYTVPKAQSVSEGVVVARYRLTARVTSEGGQVYEHIPE